MTMKEKEEEQKRASKEYAPSTYTRYPPPSYDYKQPNIRFDETPTKVSSFFYVASIIGYLLYYIHSFCLLIVYVYLFIGTIYTSYTQKCPQIHHCHPPFQLRILLFNHNHHSITSYSFHKGQRITSLVIWSSTIPPTYIRFNGPGKKLRHI